MSDEVYAGHGHVFEVEAPDPLQARVADVLRTLRVTGQAPIGRYLIQERGDGWDLRWQDEDVGSRTDKEALLLLLHWHINQRTVDEVTERFTTMHAAAACSPRGTGVLLPAPMESGKTTTCTGLLRRGWAYLTDEAAAVTPEGAILAYPKPLTIDIGSWSLFPDLGEPRLTIGASSWLVPVTAIPESRVAESAAVDLIVFPRYKRDAPTEAKRLRPSEAALALTHSSFFFDRHGGRDLRCGSRLARQVAAYDLQIGDLDEALDLIESLEEQL